MLTEHELEMLEDYINDLNYALQEKRYLEMKIAELRAKCNHQFENGFCTICGEKNNE